MTKDNNNIVPSRAGTNPPATRSWSRRWLRFRKSEDGAAAVEFALVSIPFFLILFSILEQGAQIPVPSRITSPILNFLVFNANKLIPLITIFRLVAFGFTSGIFKMAATAVKCSA